MSINTLKASLISGLKGERHCIDALEILLDEIPYEKMGFRGRFLFQSLLKSSLYRRKQFLRFKKNNVHKLKPIHVRKPIFVIGLPRSGTTLLQNLIIRNFNIPGIPFWEIIHPIPKFKNQICDKYFRKIRGIILLKISKILGPQIDPMHPVTLNSYEECWHLFLMTFQVYNFDFQMGLTQYGSWLSENFIDMAYEEYAKILQIIIHLRKDHRLILKCPEHMLFTDIINQIFPENKIIWIHRDPAKSIISYTNMIYEIHKFYFGHANKKDVARFVTDRFYHMIERLTYARDKLGVDIIDIQYKNLVSNQKNTLQYLADKCQLDISNVYNSKGNQDFSHLKSKATCKPAKVEIDSIYHQFNNYMEKFQINKEI